MIRSFRAELLKLRRPSVLYGAGAVLPAFALLATVLAFANAAAGPSAPAPANNGFDLTLTELARSGGLTRGFTGAATFIGVLVFVLFLTSTTGEYGHGTLRVLLTRQPARLRLLAGKLLALLAFTAATLLAAEIVSAVAAVAMAQVRDVPTAEWFTGAGLARAGGDYGNALLTAGLFGAVGTVLGVLVRSTGVALGVGLAWFLPLEHIIQNSWAEAGRWFPGLLFEAVARGGTTETPYARALVLALVLAVGALVVGGFSFARRDVRI